MASDGDRFRIISLVTPYGTCNESMNQALTPNAEIRLSRNSVRIVDHPCRKNKFNVIELSVADWQSTGFFMKIQSAGYEYVGDANGDTTMFLYRKVTAEDQVAAHCKLSKYRRHYVNGYIPSPYAHHILNCRLFRVDNSQFYGSIVLRN